MELSLRNTKIQNLNFVISSCPSDQGEDINIAYSFIKEMFYRVCFRIVCRLAAPNLPYRLSYNGSSCRLFGAGFANAGDSYELLPVLTGRICRLLMAGNPLTLVPEVVNSWHRPAYYILG